MEQLCEDSTLKNLVIMMRRQGPVNRNAGGALESELSDPGGFFQAVARRGAKIHRCAGASEPDLGALRIILLDRVVERYKKLEESMQDAVDKKVEDLRRELEEQRRRAQREAEEQKRKAQEEVDGLRKSMAELGSGIGDDRHGFGKTSATYNFRHVPARSRVFLVGSLTHLALQRVYPLTDLRPNSPIVSTTHFTAGSMNNGCKTFGRMTSSGSLTIWIRHVTMSPLLT